MVNEIIFGGAPQTRTMNAIEGQPAYVQDLIRQIVGGASGIAGDRNNFMPQTPIGLSKGASEVLLPAIESGSFIAGSPGFNFGKRASVMYDTAGQTLQSALPFFQQGGQPITTDQVNTATGEFMNPYEQQVIQGMLGDLQEQAAYGDAQIRGQSKAFGGSGMALQQAELQKNLMDTSAQQAGNLRYQGYQSAQERAKSLLEGNRAGAFQAGQGITNVGNSQTSLGSNLMSARQTMENIRQQQTEGNLRDLNARLAASDMMLTPQRQQAEYDYQVQQIPFRQLETLQAALKGLPLDVTLDRDNGTPGLLGSYGDVGAGISTGARDVLEMFGGNPADSLGEGSSLAKLGTQAAMKFLPEGVTQAALAGLEGAGITGGANALASLAGIESAILPGSAMPGAVAAAGKPLAAGAAGLSGGSGSATLAGGVGADILGGAGASTAGMSTMAALGMTALPFAALAGLGMMTQDGTRPVRGLGERPDVSNMQDATGIIRQTTDQPAPPPAAVAAYNQLDAAQKNLIKQYTASGGKVLWDAENGRFITTPRDGTFDQGIAIAPGSDIGVSKTGAMQSGLSGVFSPSGQVSDAMMRLM